MRRMLWVACAAVVAASAFLGGSNSALAQNVFVFEEAGGNECPDVRPSSGIEHPRNGSVEGGCVFHMVNTEGLVTITAHIFGVESTDAQCATEFTPRIDGSGEGYFTNIGLYGGSCSKRTCRDEDDFSEAWGFHFEENGSNGRIEIHLCVENLDGSWRQTCHVFIPFKEESSFHSYEVGTVNAQETRIETPCEGFDGYKAELSGHWKTETTSLELVHSF